MSRRGRRPTEAERTLWEAAAGSWRRRSETAIPPPVPQRADPAAASRLAAPPPPPPLTLTPAAAPAPPVFRPPGRSEPPVRFPAPRPPRPSGLDRATETRLRKGRLEPEARIDLHGLRADEAHRAVSAFVLRSREAGRRLVLVVTGKGGLGEAAPGRLRREAPFWFESPPLAGLVVNVTPAHARHGGGGALYVYLKRPPR